MKEKAIYFKSAGFKPKTFINMPEEEQFDIIYDNGLIENIDNVDDIEQIWPDIFFEINENFNNKDYNFTKCNLSEEEVLKEVSKTIECVGNTLLFALANINTKEWLQKITEYMVYMEHSIASLPGTIIYWMILQGFFEEEKVNPTKSKKLVQFILRKNDIIYRHKYIDEIYSFSKAFPYKPLGTEKIIIPDIFALLEIYPSGILNRFLSERFPKIPKTLSREKIIDLLHKHLKIALSEFNTEELWKKGDHNAIKEFLIECAIQENKVTKQEILHSAKTEYTKTIKQWLRSQVKLIKQLNEIEHLYYPKQTINLIDKNGKKIGAKYIALYHRILVELKLIDEFRRNDNDCYIKSEIIEYSSIHYGIKSSGFYDVYKTIDLSNKIAIANSYINFKEKIRIVSNNNAKILHYLKDFPE